MINEHPDHVFVYGLLRKKTNHPMAHKLTKRTTWKGEGYTYGLLYDLGQYPGVLPDPGHRNIVIGDIYKIEEYGIIDELDYFEGIGPEFTHPYEYKRKAIEAYLDEKTYYCWMYIYNRTIGLLPKIEHGDYIAYLKNN